jgi:hypothetical protein
VGSTLTGEMTEMLEVDIFWMTVTRRENQLLQTYNEGIRGYKNQHAMFFIQSADVGARSPKTPPTQPCTQDSMKCLLRCSPPALHRGLAFLVVDWQLLANEKRIGASVFAPLRCLSCRLRHHHIQIRPTMTCLGRPRNPRGSLSPGVWSGAQ